MTRVSGFVLVLLGCALFSIFTENQGRCMAFVHPSPSFPSSVTSTTTRGRRKLTSSTSIDTNVVSRRKSTNDQVLLRPRLSTSHAATSVDGTDESSIENRNEEQKLEASNIDNNETNVIASARSKKLLRFKNALPQFMVPKKYKMTQQATEGQNEDDLDGLILRTAIPSMINLGVVPVVNSIDTFWVGRLGVALALAGQAAANQASFTIFFLIAFLPNITAPLVARAVASGNTKEAQEKVCESLFLCNLLGLFGTLLLVGFPKQVLGTLVLESNAPAMQYAAPYLRWRALGIVPSLISATGSAAYRGLLNTVTPLKVSLMTNAVNLVLDPLLIFSSGMGFVGAAVATAAAELISGLTYLRLLMRRGLAKWSLLVRPTSFRSLIPLLQGGAAMLFRQLALNVGFLAATRRAQSMDPSGVAGAAYGITMQMYSVGIIMLVAIQGTAAALVPATLAKTNSKVEARQCADRLFSWSTLAGCMLGLTQFLLLPVLVPVFSTLPEVREAVRAPALIASLIHVVNGPVLAGEGVMIGLGSYKDLALITAVGIAGMVSCLTLPMGKRLDGIMWSILISSLMQQVGVIWHYLKVGPLAARHEEEETTASAVTLPSTST